MEQDMSSSLPAQSPSQDPQPESLKSVEAAASSPGALRPPPRWPGRQFEKAVQRSPVSPEARQKILTIFEFGSGRNQPDDVFDELEKLMGYTNWPFTNESDRRRVICSKAKITLYKFLWSLGYYRLTNGRVDGKGCLTISPPAKGPSPKPLPEWLSTPYIRIVPYQCFPCKPDGGLRPEVR